MTKLINRIGIDWGDKTVGIALGLPNQKSLPLIAIDSSQLTNKLKQYIVEYEISEIVIGLPEGKNVEKIIKFGEDLSNITLLPVKYENEKNSSNVVRSTWFSSNIPMKKLSKKEHSLAACEILDRYMIKLGEKNEIKVE